LDGYQGVGQGAHGRDRDARRGIVMAVPTAS
jgi:hypothetical protein